MGYDREIVLIKNQLEPDFTALDLIKSLKPIFWEPTYSVMDKGTEFNWV